MVVVIVVGDPKPDPWEVSAEGGGSACVLGWGGLAQEESGITLSRDGIT